jgi:hypothetical protein
MASLGIFWLRLRWLPIRSQISAKNIKSVEAAKNLWPS